MFTVVVNDFAVQSGCVMMSGFLAWLVWVLIYIQFLAEGSLWFSVIIQFARLYDAKTAQLKIAERLIGTELPKRVKTHAGAVAGRVAMVRSSSSQNRSIITYC